jgi:hypothetical protein
MKKLFVLLLIIIFYSCNQNSPIKTQDEIYNTRPKANLQTPENAVKTYLTFKTWSDTVSMNRNDNDELVFYSQSSRQYIQDSFKKIDDKKRNYYKTSSYVIDKVVLENDRQALVFTKESVYPNAESLVQVKYALTKNLDTWLIDDILDRCFYCNKDGKTVDIYSNINSDCKYCGGTGWKSKFYQKN